MRSTSGCADCWTCPTLPAPPAPASSGLDRARVVSLRQVFFSFFCHLFPRIYSYVKIQINLKKNQMKIAHLNRQAAVPLTSASVLRIQDCGGGGVLLISLILCSSAKIPSMMMEVSSRPIEDSVLYAYVVLLPLVVLLCVLLILFSFFVT